MDKKWEAVGYTISIIFLTYTILTIIEGIRNLKVNRSKSDFYCKIYGYFLYPPLKAQKLCCIEIIRNIIIVIYFNLIEYNKFIILIVLMVAKYTLMILLLSGFFINYVPLSMSRNFL